MNATDKWTPEYSRWRHGGWYVHNTRYPYGGCGCVAPISKGKWRIVCDPRPNADTITYNSRDEAARIEHELAPTWFYCGNCRHQTESSDNYCANCGHQLKRS